AMLREETPDLPLLEEPTTAMYPAPADWEGLGQRELILFGGKGGVGKTTVTTNNAGIAYPETPMRYHTPRDQELSGVVSRL
ncbi:MAG: hypothetical protein ACE5JL_09740, partial [Dehalococcoidia bacterium]